MDEISSIKAIRKKLGITQGELAIKSGVSQSLIAKIESGNIDPSYTNAKNIFETLRQIESKNEITAKEMLNSRIIFLSPKDTIKSAIDKMKKYEISQIPVIDSNEVVGYVSESILLDNLLQQNSQEAFIESVMEYAPPVVPESTTKEIIVSLLKQFPLVLIKEKSKLKGIITKADLIRLLYK
ncbi:MAG: CBS domain-containing protein [archaeon]